MEVRKHKERGHLMLSTDMTENEIREALAKFWGVPIWWVPRIDFSKVLQGIRDKIAKVNSVTADLKAKLISSKATADKFEELDEIGRFIVVKDASMKLIVPEVLPKHPDFTVAYKNYTIGVEHTRLVAQEMKAIFKTVKYCLKKAQALLAGDLAHLSKTVNISIDYDKPIFNDQSFSNGGFSRKQKEEIWISIADFVRSKLTKGKVKQPDFINRIDITPNKDSRVDIEISERYITETNLSQALIDRIQDKENKAANYRNAINVDFLWLLIVVDDVNSFSGFDLEEGEVPVIKESKFDNIILFEKQSGTIKSIYSNNSIL